MEDIKTFATEPRYEQEERKEPASKKERGAQSGRPDKGDPYPTLPRRALIRDRRPDEKA